MVKTKLCLSAIFVALLIIGCSKEEDMVSINSQTDATGKTASKTAALYPNCDAAFGTKLNLNSLANYAAQGKPSYILKDNTGTNTITDAKATLGRVLFYDKNLSIDNTISCGSCHKQASAFGDPAVVSNGVQGAVTTRHSMRLIDARFASQVKFFWDVRANTLETQTTQPIQAHNEMGYSGLSGRPTIATLLVKLKAIGYYNELFRFVYGDTNVSEARLKECLAQFIRSIQSFDSKYDIGRAQVTSDNVNFPNFTATENLGKSLFMTAPTFGRSGSTRLGGGVGCNGCHRAPEFDIAPGSGNNGIISVIGSTAIDLTVKRSPSLRCLTKPDGSAAGPMMHTASKATLRDVLLHYNNVPYDATINTALDAKLRPNGAGQKLNMTETEITAVTAFLQTLSGAAVFTDPRWSSPFL